jgi:Tfp pilus assembly protein PilX
MILLVLTIIGVSSIGSTNLEERMAQNYQNTAITFQAAESAINIIRDVSDPGGSGVNDNPFYVAANDPMVAAINAGLGVNSTTVTIDMDPNNLLTNISLSTTSSIVYSGPDSCPGMSMGTIICHYFEVSSDATLAEINHKTTHIQGMYRPAPAPS